MAKDRIIIRPMYNTDPGFCNGMRVAVWESTGEIIKRHFDNVLIHIPQELRDNHEILLLPSDQINWELTKKKAPTEYQKRCAEVSKALKDIKQEIGDSSDLGNEIGIILGKYAKENNWDVENFINGLMHGVSITDGTHP